jgi:hypothetical protein
LWCSCHWTGNLKSHNKFSAFYWICRLLVPFTHSFSHGFGTYVPSVHAESVSVNAQPAETPGAWSLPTCPACRSELAWKSHGHSNTSVETLFPSSSCAVTSV